MILKLKPILLEKIWGGTKLGEMYQQEGQSFGECWGISAHKTYSNQILEGEFAGQTLRDLYTFHRSLFGNYSADEFPILVKLIDAAHDLSIQVHPDDSYAKAHEHSHGKEECWYILDADKNTQILIGHSAKTTNEIKHKIQMNDLLSIINTYHIKPKDYFYIPAGTIHAICAGTFLLEVSQSSDITYRLYDYDRLDHGKKRDLHINESLDVIRVPDENVIRKHQNKYFKFELIEQHHDCTVEADQYGDYITILEGQGFIDDFEVKKGDFFMISSHHSYRMTGTLTYHRSRLI